MNNLLVTLAVFEVEDKNHAAFIEAWTVLCKAFKQLPNPPASPMTLIQSQENKNIFQSLGMWNSQADILAMRADAHTAGIMGHMMGFTLNAKPGVFEVLKII